MAQWSGRALCLALWIFSALVAAAPTGTASAEDCVARFNPSQLWIKKSTTPPSPIDTRQRSIVVGVEWVLQVTLELTDSEALSCDYDLLITDTIPALPLRVPNADAHFFTTGHPESYLMRRYRFSLSASSQQVELSDAWNYTLQVQMLSLTPLNDSLAISLLSPLLSISTTQDGKDIAVTARSSPENELLLKLHYSPTTLSLSDTLYLSLACVIVISCLYGITVLRLTSAVQQREERFKGTVSKPASSSHVVTEVTQESKSSTSATETGKTAASTEASVSVPAERDSVPADASAHAMSSEIPAPAPYRFKAKSTRKRFTHPPPGALDF